MAVEFTFSTGFASVAAMLIVLLVGAAAPSPPLTATDAAALLPASSLAANWTVSVPPLNWRLAKPAFTCQIVPANVRVLPCC